MLGLPISALGAVIAARDAIDDGTPNPRGESLSQLAIVFVALSAFFVLARFLTRVLTHQVGWDDGLIGAALVLTAGMAATYNGEANNGFGLHSYQVSEAHQIIAFQYFFAAQILYKIATCLTKLSIGIMYLRIFPGRKFRIGIFIVMGVTVTYTLVAVLLTVFSCNPINKAWVKSEPGTCLDSRSIWYSTSVLIIITDLLIILAPINEIRRLQLPLIKKVMLGGLFSLGVFVIACTIVRMITVTPQTTATDQTYYQAISNSWTFVETNVGIICACLPVLRVPLTKSLRRFLGLRSKTTTNGSKTAPSFALGTIGQISSPGRSKNVSDAEGDSVEDLIMDQRHGGGGGGIQVTKAFSSSNASHDQQQQQQQQQAAGGSGQAKEQPYGVTVRQYPAWQVDEKYR